MEINQIFKLIDTLIPLEVCLYHKVVPLSRQESCLYLGIVDPQDVTALGYIHKMLQNLNCTLVPQKISPEKHKSMLSAYLNYQKQSSQPAKSIKAPPPPSKTGFAPPPPKNTVSIGAVKLPAPPSREKVSIGQVKEQVTQMQMPKNDSQPAKANLVTSAENNLPQLKIQAPYLSMPLEKLANLSPPKLLQELLGRVLVKGIGRLCFERQRESGRVLWSQEGVMQSALENLPMPIFQGLMVELKRFFNLSSIPVDHPRQVDMERMMGQTHLVLILQLTPGEWGEEASLQVLRGKALKFYKQQKIQELSEDALKLAQQLQRKLSEIGDRFDPSLTLENITTLPAIHQILQHIDQQLLTLKQKT